MRKLLPLLLLLAGCSFTTGSGFNECEQSSDCPSGRVCQQNFCVSVKCTESYGATDAGNAIVFGAAIPFTDATGVTDQSERVDFEAALLALDEVNQPGRSPRPIALYACDTEGDQTQLTNELKYLIDQKKAVAILTSQSSQTLAAVGTTVPDQVLVMTATSTATEIASTPATAPLPGGGTVRMLWRTAPSDSIQGAVIADEIINNPRADAYLNGVSKVGILYVNDAYGQGLFEVISTALASSSKTSQGFQFTRGGDPTSALNSLASFGPDLTVLIGFPDDLVRILNQADGIAALSGKKWFFTDAAKDPALLSIANPAQIEGALGSNPAQGAGAAFQSFSQRFQAAYGTDANQYSFTGHSYDAMYLLALGSAWAMGPSPYSGVVSGPTIADGLTHVSSGDCASAGPNCYQLTPTSFTATATALGSHQSVDVQGASGELTFDPQTGEAPSPIQLWRVQSGQIVNVATVNPP